MSAGSKAPKNLSALKFITDPDQWSIAHHADMPSSAQESAPESAPKSAVVTFAKTGTEAIWDDPNMTLLELAEAQGLTPRFMCRSGLCGRCRTNLLEGEVHYPEPPLAKTKDGQVLICCSRPAKDVTLDL